jgi:hypothetical protein
MSIESLSDGLIVHLYALVWFTTHIIVGLLVVLLVLRKWTLLITTSSLLYLFSMVTFAPRPKIAKFLHRKFLRAFNGVTTIRLDAPYDMSSKVIYCFHPHALVANGFGLSVYAASASRSSRITLAIATSLYWLNPAFRWFVNIHGCDLCTVRSKDLQERMKKGLPIAICPGGIAEVLLMSKNKDVYFLKRRRGFLRLARHYEYTVIPILALGESQLYDNALPISRRVGRIAARYAIPLVWPRGRSMWNFKPKLPARGLQIVFGEIFPVKQRKSLDELQETYIHIIENIFKRYNPYDDFKAEILCVDLIDVRYIKQSDNFLVTTNLSILVTLLF